MQIQFDRLRLRFEGGGSARVRRTSVKSLNAGGSSGAMAMANSFSLEPFNGGATELSRLRGCNRRRFQVDRLRLGIEGGGSARVNETSVRSLRTGGSSVAMAIANSLSLESINGGATELSALKVCKCRGFQFGRLRIEGRGGVTVRRSANLNGGGVSEAEDGGSDAAMWLREQLPVQLERDGVEIDASRRIAEACADACARFLATGRAFDPVMIMDAMEEEIERRDLRGDEFLPFELGRRAAKVLTERWNALPMAERPKAYRQQAFENKKDVVDFDKWPENLNLP